MPWQPERFAFRLLRWLSWKAFCCAISYLDRESRLGFLQLYHAATALFPVTLDEEKILTPPCRDSRDNKFLALALHCSAQTVISSDEDLLILNPWHEITIVSPAQFLS